MGKQSEEYLFLVSLFIALSYYLGIVISRNSFFLCCAHWDLLEVPGDIVHCLIVRIAIYDIIICSTWGIKKTLSLYVEILGFMIIFHFFE